MTTHEAQLERRLARVRLRWRLTASLRGALLVITEALGMFCVFLLADWIYKFAGQTRLILLLASSAVLAVLAARHCLWPMLRRLPDEQIALFIEERAPDVEGAAINALECGKAQKGGLSAFIAGFLVDDAGERHEITDAFGITEDHRAKF